ncbi:MAG: YfhO family protein [Anaerolineae bacterium]|nr:YfhO family protein [Anaerolineae bacterium]
MTPLTLIGIWLVLWALVHWMEQHGHTPPGTRWDVAAVGAIALAVLGFFWRVVSGQAYMPADGGDLASFLYPMYRFAAQTLRSGHLPLWNPHLYGGTPFIADPQNGLLYPINLLTFLLLPHITYRTMEGLSLFHFWWMGTGAYFLFRELPRNRRLSRWAALAGALAVTFSDPMLVHFGNLNLIAVGSWLPWTLWAFRRSEARSSWRWTIISGLLLGIGTLAGHPQMSLFIGLALALDTAILLLLMPRWDTHKGLTAIVRLGGTAIISGLIAAPVLLPAWQLTQHTARATWDYTQTVGYSLSPAQLIGWIIPGFFGRGPQFHWGPWDRVEIGYLGILPLMLAALAVFVRRDRAIWRLAGLAVGSLLIALGIYALPHGWMTWIVPGLSQLRAPARMVLITDLAVAALAALGLDVALREGHVARERVRSVRRGTWAIAGTLGLVTLGLYLALITRQDADPSTTLHIAVALISAVLSLIFAVASALWLDAWRTNLARRNTLAWVAVVIILLDLGSGAYNDLSAQEPTHGFDHPALVQFLRAQPGPTRIDARTGIETLWQPSAALIYGLDDVWGVVNPLTLRDYAQYWEGMGSRSSRLYDFLNTGFVIARKDVTLDWNKFELAFDGDPELNAYRNRSALPRAQVVYQAIAVTSHTAAWDAIHAPGFDPGRQVVIEGNQPPANAPISPTPATWQLDGPNRVRITAELAAPGYLVVSQTWYPGWQAKLETGKQLPILRANYAFQAIPLPAGQHTVTLTFRPWLWWTGLAIELATLLASMVALIVTRHPQPEG